MAEGTICERYANAVAEGIWRDNPDQSALAAMLDERAARLQQALNDNQRVLTRVLRWSRARAFRRGGLSPYAGCSERGLYIFGSVGTGKTKLMDWFWQSMAGCPGVRLHFYAFMHEVHTRVAAYRRDRDSDDHDDPVVAIGHELAAEHGLICLDELFVQDIADAMILGRLFEAIFAAGAFVVCTSNCSLQQLYAGGLHRDRFEPFVAMLERTMVSYHLRAPLDYRTLARRRSVNGYVVLPPEHVAAERANHELWHGLISEPLAASGSSGEPITEAERGVHPQGAVSNEAKGEEVAGIAISAQREDHLWVNFRSLCGGAYGAQQYAELIARYGVIFVSDVEVMQAANRDLARRFVTFIDLAYEARVVLAVSARAPLSELCNDHKLPDLTRMASRIYALTNERIEEQSAGD